MEDERITIILIEHIRPVQQTVPGHHQKMKQDAIADILKQPVSLFPDRSAHIIQAKSAYEIDRPSSRIPKNKQKHKKYRHDCPVPDTDMTFHRYPVCPPPAHCNDNAADRIEDHNARNDAGPHGQLHDLYSFFGSGGYHIRRGELRLIIEMACKRGNNKIEQIEPVQEFLPLIGRNDRQSEIN